jgi:hypothetical protein
MDIVRAKLIANPSDATITPLEALNESVGEKAKAFFSWQVKPLVAGELKLSAYIECPLSDGHVSTQIVPLRIAVDRVQSTSGPGERVHRLLELMKSYWAQLTAIFAGLLAAARIGWRWYKHRRPDGPVAHAEDVPVANTASVSTTEISANAGQRASGPD